MDRWGLQPRARDVAEVIETMEARGAASTADATADALGTPTVVAAGTLKFDPATMTGNAVDIQMRDESEVLGATERETVGDITVESPAFDVAPPRYLDAVVTERGQFPPERVVTLMRELFGEGPTEPWQEP